MYVLLYADVHYIFYADLYTYTVVLKMFCSTEKYVNIND